MPVRALIDANVFISFLLYPRRDSPSGAIIRAALRQVFTILAPEQLLDEFTSRVEQKPYLARRIRADEMATFVQLLSQVAEFVPKIIEPIPAVTRDAKDDYLIAYALIGQADYLVTGDRDLLVLDQVGKVNIVTPREFLTLLENATS